MRILKKKIKGFCYSILNLISLFFPNSGASILMYHSIGENNIFSTVKPESFKKQMDYLKKRKYKVIFLADLISVLKNKKKTPQKTVTLTFDDGYEDFFLNAFPILKKYNFKATLFLTTSLIGKTVKKQNNFMKMLNWKEIREMYYSGLIDFEPHTLTHLKLTKIPIEEAKREILESKEIIERKLKKSCRFFCYPYGDYNQEIIKILKENNFQAVVTIKPGLVKIGDNLFLLKRNSIDSTVEMSEFKGKLQKSVEIFYFLKNLI